MTEEQRAKRRAYSAAYYQANKDKIDAKTRRWAAANKARRLEIARKSEIKIKYGITPDELEALRRTQNNLCAICATDTPGGNGDFHIDHCHDTGAVRGLLCMACNTGIGKLKHNPAALRKAAAYLEATTHAHGTPA